MQKVHVVALAVMPNKKTSKNLPTTKAEKQRQYRIKKKLAQTDAEKAHEKEMNKKRQQKYRENLSNSDKRKIYDQQYQYKQEVWLKKAKNKKK